MALKKGRFTKSEQKFIKENHDILSEEEMGLRLDRDPESISKYILDKIKTAPNDAELQASYDLQQRPYWRELKQQFTEEELEMLVYHWGRIISQFRDDVLPTEELQVIDAIKLEILMNRALITHHQTSEEVKDLEIRIQAEKDLGDDGDRDFILNLERQAGVLRAAIETISKDYNNLQAKKSGMLKDLKATREQRVKRLEDSKTTFIGWLRRLMEEPELRYQLGVNMEKMRIATEMERKRLTEYHSYEDDGVDQPFLTPEDAKD
jgi:hypothetical protein